MAETKVGVEGYRQTRLMANERKKSANLFLLSATNS